MRNARVVMIISWLVELCLILPDAHTYFWRPYSVWLTTILLPIMFAKALNFGEDWSLPLISIMRAGFALIDDPAIKMVATAKDVQLFGAVVAGSMAFWQLIHQETDDVHTTADLRLRSIAAVNAMALAIEWLCLIDRIVPANYKVTWTTELVPNGGTLFTKAFWAAYSAWLLIAIALPIGCSVVFNMIPTYTLLDPFTFAMSRGLAAFIFYQKGFTCWGLLDESAVKTVGAAIGVKWSLFGAGSCAIAALWVGVRRGSGAKGVFPRGRKITVTR